MSTRTERIIRLAHALQRNPDTLADILAEQELDLVDYRDPTKLTAEQEVERLRDWKESALVQLSAWDEVFEELGRPGPLGRSKQENCLAEIRRLQADAERFRGQ